MTIHNKPAFRDAQSLAKIAYFAGKGEMGASYWISAMKSLKEAYGVK